MTSGWILTLMTLVEVLGVALLLHFLPDWSRPEHFFALTVPASFRASPEGRAILRACRRRLWIGTAVAVALALAPLVCENLTPVILAPVLVLIVWAWAYLVARREIAPAAVPPAPRAPAPGEAEALVPPDGPPGGTLGLLAPFLLLGAMALYLRHRWGDIPDRFISHWNGRFEPDGWMHKTPLSLGFALLLGAVFCLLMALLAVGIFRGSRWVSPGPEVTDLGRRRRHAVVWILVVLNIYLAAVFAAVAAAPLIQSPAGAKLFVVLILVGSLLGPILLLVVWFVRYGKEFTAAGRQGEAQPLAGAPPLGDRTDDRHWKAGLVYYNPDDPALWIEKRLGIGYTLNFARAGAWWFLAAVLVIPLALTLLLLLLQ